MSELHEPLSHFLTVVQSVSSRKLLNTTEWYTNREGAHSLASDLFCLLADHVMDATTQWNWPTLERRTL